MVWVILALAALAVVAYLLWRARQRPAAPPAPHPDPFRQAEPPEADELRGLAPGAVVTHQGRDWTVRGTLDFDEGSYRWAEHLLDDATTRRWLSVEDGETLQVTLWEGVPLADLEAGSPGDPEITVSGTAYRLQERGEAAYTATGTTGTAPAGRCTYADYAAADGRHASCERYDTGGWEVGVGTAVNPVELTIYPAAS